MDDWQPIEAVRVEVIGTRAESDHYLDVAVQLSAAPPQGWAEWLTSCSGISVPRNLRAAWRVEGSQIRIPVADSDLEGWVAKTKECIAKANEMYESQVLPGVLAREKAERDAESETERRLADARRRAEQL